jgi:hypothetical protein
MGARGGHFVRLGRCCYLGRRRHCTFSPYLVYDPRLCEAELRATRGGLNVSVTQKYSEEDA